jgi:hypothetical protein
LLAGRRTGSPVAGDDAVASSMVAWMGGSPAVTSIEGVDRPSMTTTRRSGTSLASALIRVRTKSAFANS